jgi:sensor histidine kinase YesM
MEIVVSLSIWLMSFLLVSWLVEGGFWLHFFLSSTSSYSLYTSLKRELFKLLEPLFQTLDNHINSLYEKNQVLEEEVENLKHNTESLEHRLNDIEDKLSPSNHS